MGTGFLLGIIAILAMEFPIVSGTVEGNQFIWDLRWIPFVFGLLYMGPVTGVVSGLLLVIYRFGLGGGVAAINVCIVAVVLFIFFMAVKERYSKMHVFNKYLSSIFLSIITFTIVLTAIGIHFLYMNSFPLFLSKGPSVFLQMGVAYVLAFLIYTYFLESTLSNINVREQVYRMEKLELVSDLAATMFHELRNPLTTIRGFIGLMINQLSKKNQMYMNIALKEIDRAEYIISDYLNLAKSSTENRNNRFSVSKSLEETMLLMKAHGNKNGTHLSSDIEQNLYMYGDNFKLKQALLNILKNAIEATKNGEVKVAATFIDDEDSVMVTVTDNGCGMTKEELRSLGTPYYTSKSNGKGLGVMATFQLIKSMNGTIEYKSEKGQGTIVTMVFNGEKEKEQATDLDKDHNIVTMIP